ncbi:unnamed protein product [Hydatigera taeniaeformis]|uniref:C2H2-type domain-containing protein n=1 Tax=Hydatigena taeniaeformis TaxID=6205 RepID=A0A0R3WU89_HYDTA|nr:unnamed protein product [Hydatigera taeniaeformis]
MAIMEKWTNRLTSVICWLNKRVGSQSLMLEATFSASGSIRMHLLRIDAGWRPASLLRHEAEARHYGRSTRISRRRWRSVLRLGVSTCRTEEKSDRPPCLSTTQTVTSAMDPDAPSPPLTEIASYVCDTCGSAFKNDILLRAHLVHEHQSRRLLR